MASRGGRRKVRISQLTFWALVVIWGNICGTSLAVHLREAPTYQDCAEKSLEKREEEANVVFTGTVKGLYPDYLHPEMMKAQVEVKRVLKGNSVINTLPGMAPHRRAYSRSPWTRRVVTVDGIGDPRICDSYARKYDTRIFMMDKMENGELKLKSSLMRLTLNNLDRADAAVKDKPFVPKPTPPDHPCETHYCAFGAKCMVTEENEPYCKCLVKCTDLFTPVCGNDGVTYTSECQLRVASCSNQRRIVVASQGECNVKNPCLEKHCSFGAVCKPSLDGLTARCQCPSRCDKYGDSENSHPVCADNGKDYENECEMRKEACNSMTDIKIKYPGKCDPCEDNTCPMSQICQLDENRNSVCRCNNNCPFDFAPVCGSDGRTYSNHCMMQMEACKNRKEIRILYQGECSNGNNPCNQLSCGEYEECHVDRSGRASCTCPPPCEPVLRPVCGSDDKTYDSECELKRTSCQSKQHIAVSFYGKCDGPCTNYKCRYEAICVVRGNSPECECPTCDDNFDPVCGTDGVSYTNECKLKVENCEQQKKVRIASQGLCNGCDDKKCEYYGLCRANGQGGIHCVCPGNCVQVQNEVCGSDGQTYINECELRLASCNKQKYIVIESHGACGMCIDVHCPFGARCEKGHCICPQDCAGKVDPICASDQRTYANECEMRRQACNQHSELEIVHSGPCDDEIGISGDGSGMEDCDESSCQFGGTCDSDDVCMCNFNCDAIRAPVCGSDEKTYGNECQMREESCRQQMEITMTPMENCEDMYEELCDGNPALVDPRTGDEYDCGNGRDSCPAGSYCHRVNGVSRCCKEEEPIRGCAETRYGCCPDGKTPAPGVNNAGCPATCQCNPLGSLSATCDPLSRQCTCKGGVGGFRCDRCEPGYWGLRLISDGNSGCIPCGCSIYGSVRDDCDQSTGKCSCKPAIEGQRCQECRNGKMLGPAGCSDVSPPNRPCQDLDCRFGGQCVTRPDGIAECVCPSDCSTEEYPVKVCGTNGQSYGSACQLQHLACRFGQNIEVAYEGECTGPTSSPTGGRSRKTTRHVNGKSPGETTTSTPYGTIGDFCVGDDKCFVPNSYCKMGLCTCMPGYEPNRRQTACEVETTTVSTTTTAMPVTTTTMTPTTTSTTLTTSATTEAQSLTTLSPTTTSTTTPPTTTPTTTATTEPTTASTTESITASTTDAVVSDPCESSPCQNGGKCRPRSKGGFRCKCPDGTQGALCEEVNEPTTTTEAKTTTTTTPTTMSTATTLPILTTQEELDPCASQPCQNGGKCRPRSTAGLFRCKCPDTATGPLCETVLEPTTATFMTTTTTLPILSTIEEPSSPCTPNPCLNGGKCRIRRQGTDFRCKCPDGTSGDLCQDVLNNEFPSFSSMMMSDQGVVSPVEVTTATSYVVPSFSGESFMQLTRIPEAGDKTFIEIEFRSTTKDGILLYNGQYNDERGDFISLAIKDGFVEFKFDLGSGSANLKSSQQISLNTFHRVVAKREGKGGMLYLDNNPVVTGVGSGMLKTLNLLTPLYLGSIPDASEIVLKSIGVFVGFSGCIESLKVTTRKEIEYNLMYPGSADIEAEEGITECGQNPCSSMPCQNGGSCRQLDAENYECECQAGFSGKICDDNEVEGATSCDPNPCEHGGTCTSFEGGYFCTCPSGRDGDHCEKEAVSDVTVPEMHGHSYMEVRLNRKPGRSLKFELWFLTTKPDGMLLYGVQEDEPIKKADFLSLNLADAYLQFRYDLGSGMADIVSPEKITLNVWHKVEISRRDKQGMMVIDGDVTVTGTAQGKLNELNLPKRLYIGGYPGDYHPDSGGSTGLRGAIQRFYQDGTQMDDLTRVAISQKHIRQYDGEPCPSMSNPCSNAGICIPNLNDFECLCLEGYLGRTCDVDAGSINTDGPVSFNSQTRHRYPNKVTTKQNGQQDNDYEIRFRTTASDGLLLLQHKSADVQGDYLAIAISSGYVEVSYNLGKESPDRLFFLRSNDRVNNGRWHTLRFTRDKRKGSLTVGKRAPTSSVSTEGATQLDTDGILWIGSAESVPEGLPGSYYQGFDGCIDSIHVDGIELLLVENRISNDDIEFCSS